MSDKRQWKKYNYHSIIVEAYQTDVEKSVTTLNGTKIAFEGDFIVRDGNGCLDICDPFIFESMYKPVGDLDV